jgi:hypothetical protein
MEIASAFSSRQTNGNASVCLRYETENITAVTTPPGQERIDRFYWPMADMAVERFESGKPFRKSVLQTMPSAKAPTLDSTDLYAFKRSRFNSTAYKVSVLWKRVLDVTRTSFGDNQSARTEIRLSVDEQKLAQQQTGLSVKDAPRPIGAVWQTPVTLVAATTDFVSSRGGDSITISVERADNKSVGRVYAPFALALATAKEASDIPSLIKEFSQKPIEMKDNTAQFGSLLAVTNLFVVKQPIVFFEGGGSRVCFLAPTYSPVPIPPSLLTCDPDQVFPAR